EERVDDPPAEDDGEEEPRDRRGGQGNHQCSAAPTQCGPSASWPVVLVPIGRPAQTVPVSMMTSPAPVTSAAKWSMPRGAGPPFFSPTRLYCEPWHPHSNH